MTKTLIDVDDEALALAQHELGASTKRETVNRALTLVATVAACRRDIERLTSGALPDLLDGEIMSAAWRR